jgi:hypothetical protein
VWNHDCIITPAISTCERAVVNGKCHSVCKATVSETRVAKAPSSSLISLDGCDGRTPGLVVWQSTFSEAVAKGEVSPAASDF